MTYQVSLCTRQCCELYVVSHTDNCELYLSSYEHIRRARVFFVKNLVVEIVQNLLRNSSRIHSRRCVVPHPWWWQFENKMHPRGQSSAVIIFGRKFSQMLPVVWCLTCPAHFMKQLLLFFRNMTNMHLYPGWEKSYIYKKTSKFSF